MRRRIKRSYRQTGSPAKFLTFCQKVGHALTDNPNYQLSALGDLLKQYLKMVESLNQAYHVAIDGDRKLIRERKRITEEIIAVLDQIALLLEAASTDNPDALFTTGFTIAEERRRTSRTKLPLESPTNFSVSNDGEQGKALATANGFPGVYNIEIQINRRDPSAEAEWLHKAIFPDVKKMVMENLQPGNTFFRMRYHGPEGPGPWSGTVSSTIS